MKKDTIYIDIEDDITAIIERVKQSNEKIIALVPPKGNAVLQSVVNLKLLKRASDTAGKQAVVVTSNQALTALAGGLGFYIAKNLQSKPMLLTAAATSVLDDEVDMSEGVGEVSEAGTSVSLADIDEDGDEVELSDDDLDALGTKDETAEKTAGKAKSDKKHQKIPNFDNFRKKLLIGGGVVLAVVVLLIAFFGRAKADIAIRAETTPVDVALEATFDANTAQSDPERALATALFKETKKTISQTFAATGQKDLGAKSSGTMRFINCNKEDKLADRIITIPAGTGVSASGKTFITGEPVSVEPSSYIGNLCTSNKQSPSIGVTAQSSGDSFNLSSRDYAVSGFATITGKGSQMSGGTSNVVKVISQSDIDKAQEQLNQQDASQVREELKKLFNDATILDETFTVSFANIISEPGLDQQANEGKLTAQVTYSLLAVSNKDIGSIIDSHIAANMANKDQQRVYDNGFTDLKLEKISNTDKTAKYKLTTVGYYGPQFNTEELKAQVAGKKFGEIRSYIQDLPGVKGVEIDLSPFWARKAPGPDRITISLDVDKNASDQ
jgi:hypothetical protein